MVLCTIALQKYNETTTTTTGISTNAYSKEVNAGNNAMNAELTADITGVTSHTPIGTETYKYKGTFDGKEKSITFAIDSSSDYQALVGHATGDITIQNLILKGSVTSTGSKTAGFIAEAKGGGNITITNCGNEATIIGAGGEVAAIVANNNGASCVLQLTNVYNTGSVTKTTSDANGVAAICAYCGVNFSVFKNVYNTGNVTGGSEASAALFVRNPATDNDFNHCYTKYRRDADDSDVTLIISSDVTSGKLCYKLNNETSIWKQKIGTDNYPKLFGSTGVVNQVVADKSYSNLTVSEDKVEIGSLANLNQFSAEVNAGNVEMDAILTSNITDNGTFTPIGTEDYKYKGTFDGDDHYVQLAINKSGTPFQGLFGCATGGAKFKNLIIKGNVIGGNNSAALVGQVGGDGESGTITINRVGCEVNVSGSYEHHGAFVGNDWGGSVKLEVENCYNIGDISGSATYTSVMGSWVDPNSSYTNVFNSGTITDNKFSHANRGKCNNCYTTTSGAGEVSNLVQGVTSGQITSGKLCYLLNGSTQGGTDWYQNLSGSVDAHPVFFSDHEKVYQYNTSKYVNDGDKVEISDATDLANFAALVNAGATSVDADQTADIDFSTQSAAGVMIGNKQSENPYSGTYDGQGYNVNVTYACSEDNAALFRFLSNATIRNLTTTGSISLSDSKKCAGGIFSGTKNDSEDNSLIENCMSSVSFSFGTNDAGPIDKTYGGIGAFMWGKGTIQNCAFLGSFNAPKAKGNGGILGYANGSDNIEVKNCYVKATTISVADDNDNKIIVRNTNPTTCFYVTNGNLKTQTSGAESVEADDVTSGKLCYDLGSPNWYQDLTIDDYPYPFDTHSQVYRRGESAPYTYSNITTGSTAKIKSAKDLMDFSSLVNAGNYSLNAELVNDIDMTGKSWTPIGSTTASGDGNGSSDYASAYHGTFDGKNFTIDNLVQSSDNTDNNQGLFGVVRDGCTIQNLILGSGCCFYGKNYVGAFVGSARGSKDGTITITNCGNDATVGSPTTEANRPTQHAAAFIGVVVNDNSPKVHIYNCYNKGNIYGKSGSESAILTGWFGSNSDVEVKNFYNIGTVTNPQDDDHPLYRRGSNLSSSAFDNVYHTLAKQNATEIQEGWLISGELCYRLNGSVDNGTDWYQDLSEEGYPIPFGTKTVAAGKWFNSSDNDVYYNKEGDDYTVYQLNMSDTQTEYNVPDDGTVTAKNVKMARNLSAGKWNTFCSPVALPKDGNFSAVKELTGISTDGTHYTMTFGDIDEEVENLVAGKPYMVQVSEAKSELTATDATLATAVTPVTIESGSNSLTFTGVFAKGYAPLNSFIISNNAFYLVDEANTVNLGAFRGYITTSSGSSVKALSFEFEDMGDGINSLTPALSEGEGAIYNVAGQRIQKMQKGINIVNGKKILK